MGPESKLQPPIDLRTPLSFRTAFQFPLQSRVARREVLIGAALLLIPFVGWLLNMGHRIRFVHNMQRGAQAWPAWRRYGQLLKLGTVTFLGMVEYYIPSFVFGYLAWHWRSTALAAVAGLLWIFATIAIPGYMTHYCKRFDPTEIFNPLRAFRRVLQGGLAYWHAWAIALVALLLSFLGLLAMGVGFLVTSVWFWQVAGYSFAAVFTQKYELMDETGAECDMQT